MNATCSVGSLLGSAVSFVLIITMPASAFESWGWRIPFLLAIPIAAIGLGAGQRIGSYTIQPYFVTALITAGFPASLALPASMLTYAVGPLPGVWGGVLADRYGARLPLLVGYGLFVALTVPTFMAIDSASIGTSLIGSTADLVAIWLHDLTGDDIGFGWYMTAACVVSILVAVFALPASVDYREADWSRTPLATRKPALESHS